jgi:hypothetical protein
MKKNTLIAILLTGLCTYLPIFTVSIVYNFRIAQITRKPIAQKDHNAPQRPNMLSALLFNFFQKSRCLDIRENYGGGLATYHRNFGQNYYLRTDVAAANAYQKIDKIKTSDFTESDDILFTAGRNFILSEKSKITPSLMLGIPTHQINSLKRIGFGTGQVGVGGQIDGIYKLNKFADFLWGARYNYFIPRTAFDAFEKGYTFTIGSIADVLVALQTSNPLGHGIEAGYDARWGFGAHATPTIANLDRLNHMRNNFYIVYKYTFVKERFAHRFLLNFSYGFDSKPKNIGFNAFIVWASWSIAF